MMQQTIQEKRGSDFIDILSYSFTFEVILVKADIEQVNQTLAEIFQGAIEALTDIKKLEECCHALTFQFKGHDWTLFTFFTHRDNLAQRVSEQMQSKSIYFGYGDTSGAAEYVLYDKGVRVEAYAFGTYYGEDEDPGWVPDTESFQQVPVITNTRAWNIIVTSSDYSNRYNFFGTEDRITLSEIQNPDVLLDILLRKQDAWLPEFDDWIFPGMESSLNVDLLAGVSKIAY